MLFRSPSPERINNLMKYLAEGTARVGAKAAVLAPHQLATGQASGGRVARASGGRATVNSLLNAVERAQKANTNATKVLLSVPDESIARALSIANRAV